MTDAGYPSNTEPDNSRPWEVAGTKPISKREEEILKKYPLQALQRNQPGEGPDKRPPGVYADPEKEQAGIATTAGGWVGPVVHSERLAPEKPKSRLDELRERVIGTAEYHSAAGIPRSQTEAGLNVNEALEILDVAEDEFLIRCAVEKEVEVLKREIDHWNEAVEDAHRYLSTRCAGEEALRIALKLGGLLINKTPPKPKRIPPKYEMPMDAQSVPYEGDGLYDESPSEEGLGVAE